jgi:hypothetical protein
MGHGQQGARCSNMSEPEQDNAEGVEGNELDRSGDPADAPDSQERLVDELISGLEGLDIDVVCTVSQ